MKVLENKEIEECIDGVAVKECLLDHAVGEPFIRYLGNLGKLEYFPHFPRPFYRVTKKGGYILKGVEGNRTRQIFFINYSNELEEYIHEFIEQFQVKGLAANKTNE